MLEDRAQITGAEWFLKHMDCGAFTKVGLDLGLAVAADQHHWHAQTKLSKLLKDMVTAHFWQHQVEQHADNRIGVVAEQIERCWPIFCCQHLKPNRSSSRLVTVRTCCSSSISSTVPAPCQAAGCVAARVGVASPTIGSSRSNVVPAPCTLATLSAP